MNTVLKGCLVTGYGSKLAVGWEVVYEDLATKKLAIRSKATKSIKSVLLINDTGSHNVSVTASIAWNIATNTSADTFGSGVFPRPSGTITTPAWVVIATDSFFYVWVQYATGVNYGIISGFGDVIPVGLSTDLSVLLTKSASGNNEFILSASNSGQCRFPRVPMLTGINGFGDVDSASPSHASDIAIFSRCVMYMLTNATWQPRFELPGLLMPYSEKKYVTTDPILFPLANQAPYFNPLVALHQPFQGNFWLHTDDWG